jgi:hypothetical protein
VVVMVIAKIFNRKATKQEQVIGNVKIVTTTTLQTGQVAIDVKDPKKTLEQQRIAEEWLRLHQLLLIGKSRLQLKLEDKP